MKGKLHLSAQHGAVRTQGYIPVSKLPHGEGQVPRKAESFPEGQVRQTSARNDISTGHPAWQSDEVGHLTRPSLLLFSVVSVLIPS